METVIVEKHINTSRENLWKAITNHEDMLQWYFDNIPDFKPEVGFKTAFLITNEGRQFTHTWEVTEVIPNEKITYKWNFTEYEGESESVFEIIEEDQKIGLRITDNILKAYPNNIPEFERESCFGGWTYFIYRLKEYLEKS